jgi:predicted phage-related endonuclease
MSEKPQQTTPADSDMRRFEVSAAKRIAELKRDIAVEKARRDAAQTKLARELKQRRTSERDAARLFWKQLRSWRGA